MAHLCIKRCLTRFGPPALCRRLVPDVEERGGEGGDGAAEGGDRRGTRLGSDVRAQAHQPLPTANAIGLLHLSLLGCLCIWQFSYAI